MASVDASSLGRHATSNGVHFVFLGEGYGQKEGSTIK